MKFIISNISFLDSKRYYRFIYFIYRYVDASFTLYYLLKSYKLDIIKICKIVFFICFFLLVVKLVIQICWFSVLVMRRDWAIRAAEAAQGTNGIVDGL